MASFNPELQAQTPPVLPPKPGSHETSRIATPNSVAFHQPPDGERPGGSRLPGAVMAAPVAIPDPGDQWLPQILQDKSFVFRQLRWCSNLCADSSHAESKTSPRSSPTQASSTPSPTLPTPSTPQSKPPTKPSPPHCAITSNSPSNWPMSSRGSPTSAQPRRRSSCQRTPLNDSGARSSRTWTTRSRPSLLRHSTSS